MTITNVSEGNAVGLPAALRSAQQAIHLPEVQEMLRRLSEYRSGIFMPHVHDEQTGELEPLPAEIVQVESGLAVSFRQSADVANQADRFLPVGWFWRAGASTPTAVCEMVRDEGAGGAQGATKHKMPSGNRG